MDKSGQNGHIGTKVDKKDILGQNGHFGTFIPIYTHLYPFGTLPLDKHKIPPVHLGIISLFKFLFYGKVK